MATAITTTDQIVTQGTFAGDGGSFQINTRLYMRYEVYSTTQARVYVRQTVRAVSGTWSGTNNHYRTRDTNNAYWDSGYSSYSSGFSSEVQVWSGSFIINYDTHITAVCYFDTYGGTYNTDTTVEVYVPAPTTPPTTPTCVGTSYSSTNVRASYGTTSFGTAGSGTVYLYGGTSASPTTQLQSKTTTGNTTYVWQSQPANTKYYFRARAQSSVGWSDYSSDSVAYTLAGALSWSVSSVGTTSITISFTTRAGGGAYAQEEQYSLDDGATWTTGKTVAAGTTASVTDTFTISGLSQNTTYTIKTRTRTTAGTASGTTLTATTGLAPTGGAITLSSRTWNSITLTGSVTSWGSPASSSTARSLIGVREAVGENPRREIRAFTYPDLSGTATINNSTTALAGGITLCGGKVLYPYQYVRNEVYQGFQPNSSESLKWRLPPAPVASMQVVNQQYDSVSNTTTVQIVMRGGVTDGQTNIPGLEVYSQYSYKYSSQSESSWASWGYFKDADGHNDYKVADDDWILTLSGLTPDRDYDIRFRQYRDEYGEATVFSFHTSMESSAATYDVELWNWTNGTLVFDLTPYIVGNLEMVWTLNDVEEVNFELNVEELEKDWADAGYTAQNLLKPYAYDIRIKRNGSYILGCNMVQVNYKINNNPPATVEVRGTGFLNLFKDQYILSYPCSGITYAQAAQKLINEAQQPDNLIKNGTFDIDTSYWIGYRATVSYYTSGAKEGAGCAYVNGASDQTYGGIGYRLKARSRTRTRISVWVKAKTGTTQIGVRFRQYLDQSSNQWNMTNITTTPGTWQQIAIADRALPWEDCWFYIEGYNANSHPEFYVDDVRVEEYSEWDYGNLTNLSNLHVVTNTDTASVSQQSERQYNWELQNVKDGIMSLVSQEDDNFDFEFTYDRKFNCYSRKGHDKTSLEAFYPGNIKSMTITRDASNLANKVIAIGSGIGDERLQINLPNRPSQKIYGNHESIVTKNNISLEESLISNAVGTLYDRKNPVLLPSVVIEDGSINPGNIETGDAILVTAEGDSFLGSINNTYRIQKIKATITPEHIEQMNLTFIEPIQRPKKKLIRYIKVRLAGNSVNGSCHYVEVQALMQQGNGFVNLALGRTPTITAGTLTNSNRPLSWITDGNTDTSRYCEITKDSSGYACIMIDLGALYPLDYIKIWNFYNDARIYNCKVTAGRTSTSGSTDLEYAIRDNTTSSGAYWRETAAGWQSMWQQVYNIDGGGTP